MELSTIAKVATSLAVLIALAFGVIEMHRARLDREERAPFAAVKAILSSEWMKSMIVVHGIPNGLTAAEIEADPRVLEAAHSVGVTLEGLGYSVFARILPLRVVAELVDGTVRLAGRKLSPYVEEERRRSGSLKSFEWFQWLARQLERHSPGAINLERGAQDASDDWKS